MVQVFGGIGRDVARHSHFALRGRRARMIRVVVTSRYASLGVIAQHKMSEGSRAPIGQVQLG